MPLTALEARRQQRLRKQAQRKRERAAGLIRIEVRVPAKHAAEIRKMINAAITAITGE